jgi:hypothetical protein
MYHRRRGKTRMSCGQNGPDVGTGCYSTAQHGRFLRLFAHNKVLFLGNHRRVVRPHIREEVPPADIPLEWPPTTAGGLRSPTAYDTTRRRDLPHILYIATVHIPQQPHRAGSWLHETAGQARDGPLFVRDRAANPRRGYAHDEYTSERSDPVVSIPVLEDCIISTKEQHKLRKACLPRASKAIRRNSMVMSM